MRSLKNSTQLIGFLGKDPEVKTLESGKEVATFSIATTINFKNRESGEKESKTYWFNVVAWGKLAQLVGNYLKKGSHVAIEGMLTNRSYEKDGETRYITEIILNEVEFLDKKNGSQEAPETQAAEETGKAKK